MEYLCMSLPLIVGLPLLLRVCRSTRGPWHSELLLIAAIAAVLGLPPSLGAINLWPIVAKAAPTLSTPFAPWVVVGPHLAGGATAMFLAFLLAATLRINLATVERERDLPPLDPIPPSP